MDSDELRQIRERCEKATAGEWKAYRFVDDDGQPLRGDAAKKYVADCIDKGGDDFYGVVCEKVDGPADVCHTGNGPTSDHNAAFLAHARTDLPRLLDALEEKERENAELQRALDEQDCPICGDGEERE